MTDQSAIEARCASLFSAFLSDSGPEGSGLVDLTKLGSVEFMDKVDKSTFDAIKSSIEKLQSKPALVGNTKTRIALDVGPECDVENHWWGFDMLMNENLTNKIAIGTASVATVTGPLWQL